MGGSRAGPLERGCDRHLLAALLLGLGDRNRQHSAGRFLTLRRFSFRPACDTLGRIRLALALVDHGVVPYDHGRAFAMPDSDGAATQPAEAAPPFAQSGRALGNLGITGSAQTRATSRRSTSAAPGSPSTATTVGSSTGFLPSSPSASTTPSHGRRCAGTCPWTCSRPPGSTSRPPGRGIDRLQREQRASRGSRSGVRRRGLPDERT